MPIKAHACYGVDEHALATVIGRHKLHEDVIHDWQAMQAAAEKEGITLWLVSSYRHFTQQAQIWNDKYTGLRPVLDDHNHPVDLTQCSALEKIIAIQRFSAMPGTSRHHWGSDMDVYNPTLQTQPLQLVPSEYQQGGSQWQTAQWLTAHAHTFGFFQPYARDLGGVSCEPWHLSHTAVSAQYASAWQISEWLSLIARHQIQGWQTITEHADMLIERFMQRIDHE